MQLNYIGARRGFGDHQSFFLDEQVEIFTGQLKREEEDYHIKWEVRQRL